MRGVLALYLSRMEGAMCDTNWSSRRKELERLEKSWREFEEFVEWLKNRWSKRRAPDPVAPGTETPRKPQPVTG
jgi:hypothetical protein